MASKSWKVVAGLFMLVKTNKRVEANIMRKRVHIWILPI